MVDANVESRESSQNVDYNVESSVLNSIDRNNDTDINDRNDNKNPIMLLFCYLNILLIYTLLLKIKKAIRLLKIKKVISLFQRAYNLQLIKAERSFKAFNFCFLFMYHFF